MAHIYLIRHGQAGFGTHHYDALSQLGQSQSECLGAWFKHAHIQPARVYSGTMARQWHTAQLCMAACHEASTNAADIHQDARLNEFDHLDILSAFIPNCHSDQALLEFLRQQADDPRRVFQRVFNQSVTHWLHATHKPDGLNYRETWEEFRARTQAAFAAIVREGAADDVCIFTSGGVISTLVQDALGIADARIFDLNHTLFNTGVTRVRMGRQQLRVEYLNAVAHLEWARRGDLQTYR